MLIGMLQQLRRTALTGSGGRCVLRRMGEDVGQRALLAAVVEHHEVVEQPALQGVAAAAALGLQGADGLVKGLQHRLGKGCLLLPAVFQPAQLRLLVLALTDQGLIIMAAGLA